MLDRTRAMHVFMMGGFFLGWEEIVDRAVYIVCQIGPMLHMCLRWVVFFLVYLKVGKNSR